MSLQPRRAKNVGMALKHGVRNFGISEFPSNSLKSLLERVKRSDSKFSINFLQQNQHLISTARFSCWTFCWTFHYTLSMRPKGGLPLIREVPVIGAGSGQGNPATRIPVRQRS
jgi:hypothetical protein